MPTHIYFDLDGTLTDPFEGITKCILYALGKLGFPHPSDEYLYSCIGPPLYDTFPQMVGEELTLKAIDLYRERFDEIGWLNYALDENPHASLRTMIGDRKHDLIGAVANGIRPIGVSYGYGSSEELNAAGATAIAHSPAELPGIIAQAND